jgi:hypothetical protein
MNASFSPGVADASAVIGVSVYPGEIELARTPCAPNSLATQRTT